MTDRHITRRIRGTDTTDGAGVKLKRIISQIGRASCRERV